MKRALICLSLFVLMMVPLAASASQGIATVTKLDGRADVMKPGAAAPVVVHQGDKLDVGDVVRTKDASKMEMTFVDKSVMTIGSKARLVIEEYLYKGSEKHREASLKLQRGRMHFDVSKIEGQSKTSRYDMKTTTAIAGVRGTAGVLVSEGIERVYVREGAIRYVTPFGIVLVPAGYAAEVQHGRVRVFPMSEREYKQLETVSGSPGQGAPQMVTVPDTGMVLGSSVVIPVPTNPVSVPQPPPVTDLVPPTHTQININPQF